MPASRGWDADACALVTWATWTVDSLYYLADLDARVAAKGITPPHPSHVVELAHARWAASSAVTAVDLCAAALARQLGIGPIATKSGDKEFNLWQLKDAASNGQTTGTAGAWAKSVSADPDLRLLSSIRNPTVHARLPRRLYRGGGGSEREHLRVPGVADPIEVGAVVTLARDTAARIVEDFLDQIAQGKL